METALRTPEEQFDRDKENTVSHTPYMDELSKGPWPSHAKELKKTRYPIMMYEEAM